MRRLFRFYSYRRKKASFKTKDHSPTPPGDGTPPTFPTSQQLLSATPPLIPNLATFATSQIRGPNKVRGALDCPTPPSTESYSRPLPFPFNLVSPVPYPMQRDAPRWTDADWDASVDNHWDESDRELGRMTVAIDLGTMFSGVAYGSSRIQSGRNQQIVHWPGSQETSRKIPTCIVYSPSGEVVAWGLEAKALGVLPAGYIKCEWFIPFLQPIALRMEGEVDPRLPALPPNKTALQVTTDYLSHLWTYARERIVMDVGSLGDFDTAWVFLSMPAAWDSRGYEVMRLAAVDAGLVKRSNPGDTTWKDRLKVITGSEAAAVHCASLMDAHRSKVPQTFVILDGGGGSCNSTTYKLTGDSSHSEITQVCPRSSATCGSLFLDLEFLYLVKCRLKDHPIHLNGPSIENYLHAFTETDKVVFRGEQDDETMFLFTTFNPEEPDDPAIGLVNGQLAIKGEVLRREVFDPIIDQVLELIEAQLSQSPTTTDALFMVGGFSASEYLFSRVEHQFQNRIKLIARPGDCDVAILQGAVRVEEF